MLFFLKKVFLSLFFFLSIYRRYTKQTPWVVSAVVSGGKKGETKERRRHTPTKFYTHV